MPLPMHRSNSFKKHQKVIKTGTVIHYKRAKPSMTHCAICRKELNGISLSKDGGKSRRTNNRLFGGVLCAGCTAEVVKVGSRVERGDMKLSDISAKQRTYVLQLVAH